ncbi:MAG: RNB domain-containing ribonuclease, partial [Planctomycetaceae bacterium]|nr:RNB domain-containing ribonuclease [Planctomycetaceae bacterium]
MIRQRILEFVQQPEYRPMKPQSLQKKLGIKKRDLERFQRAIQEAQAAGEIRISAGGRVQAGKQSGGLCGILRRNSAGDGFVILHDPRPGVAKPDVFVDRRDLRDAQTGDEVLIELTSRRRSGGQRCGVVMKVLERRTNVFVGTYFEEEDAGWVQIDGKDIPRPVWVGDPGAKGAVEGDKVVVEMLRFPNHLHDGEGVLTKVLGDRATPGVDTQMVIHQFGLPDEFPEQVLDEARLEAENFSEELEDREDLTKETIVTIDPVDARDFDDAISLTRSAEGHWQLGVHIADVSHFVQPGTALDREAEKRGTSVYLPTKVIPMLPEVISNGLASLQEKRLRYAISCFIEFSPEGIPVQTRFARSAIKVTKRFAYEEVLPIIEAEPGTVKHISAKVRKLLGDMHELAMLLRRRRFERGALELDMPEVKLQLDQDQKVIGAVQREHDASHQIIEEFMLAANIATATELDDRQYLFL